MKYTFHVDGMTCSSCEMKVHSSLISLDGVTDVIVSKETKKVTIKSDKNIPIHNFQDALKIYNGKYKITSSHSSVVKDERSWFETYKPVILIFIYIFTATLLIQLQSEKINISTWMRHFMAGFFLTFSFFKLLNLNGFKDSYQMYDIIAKKIPAWGYVYALLEVLLGILLLINFNPVITSSIILLVMSISVIGVLQTVLSKKTIKCACLGDVFNLPMSTVTIIEDGIMIIMSLTMLIISL